MKEQGQDEFLQLVLDGQGLTEIVSCLARVIDRHVVIIEPGGEVLATSGSDSAPATMIGLTDDDDRVLLGDQEATCVQAPVTAGTHLHGHLIALGSPDADADVLLAVESASTAAALVIARQVEIIEHEQRYQSNFMYQLLGGSISEASDAIRRSEPFGWGLDRRVIALVLRRDDPPTEGREDGLPPIPLGVRSLVLARDPRATVVRLTEEAVVITEAFPWVDGVANALRYAQSLQKVATRGYGASVSVGMSRPVTHVLDIPRAYDQAVTAFRVGKRLHGKGFATHFSELGIDRLLSLIDDHEELVSFAQEVLGDLAGDGERATDLRRTLEVLLETNVNVAESARRLHFHYNTLRFRLEKLERIVGPFRDDARVRLNVQVALLILRMVDSPSRPD